MISRVFNHKGHKDNPQGAQEMPTKDILFNDIDSAAKGYMFSLYRNH